MLCPGGGIIIALLLAPQEAFWGYQEAAAGAATATRGRTAGGASAVR